MQHIRSVQYHSRVGSGLLGLPWVAWVARVAWVALGCLRLPSWLPAAQATRAAQELTRVAVSDPLATMSASSREAAARNLGADDDGEGEDDEAQQIDEASMRARLVECLATKEGAEREAIIKAKMADEASYFHSYRSFDSALQHWQWYLANLTFESSDWAQGLRTFVAARRQGGLEIGCACRSERGVFWVVVSIFVEKGGSYKAVVVLTTPFDCPLDDAVRSQKEGRFGTRLPSAGRRGPLGSPTSSCAMSTNVRPNPAKERHRHVKHAALESELDEHWSNCAV